MHHGVATKLGNGQTRMQSNYAGVTLRREPMAAMVAYDPHYSHLTPHDRRESSASATSSIGSFESGSTLTSDVGDTAIMTRLRKSFEQKEEFLRRGITQPQEVPAVKPNQGQSGGNQGGQWSDQENNSDKGKFSRDLIYFMHSLIVLFILANQRHNREFYARPNRLQKSVWPPPEFETKRLSSVKETVNNENLSTDVNQPDDGPNPDQKLSSDGLPTSNIPTSASDVMPLQPKSTNTLPPHRLANHLAREQFYNGTKEIVVVPQLHASPTTVGGVNGQQKPMDTEDIRYVVVVYGTSRVYYI